jgi:chromosomal replication initiator protein
MARPALTFARFVATPENRAAWLAVQDVVAVPRGVMLHGPAGCGKTHLVHALAASVLQERPDWIVTILAAGDLVRAPEPTLFGGAEDQALPLQVFGLEEARQCDLLIVEDLQHLHAGAVEILVRTIDHLQARHRPLVFTANAGPERLTHRGQRLPARLTSRLAAGLVVAIEPLGPASRLTLLQTLAQRRQLAVPAEVLRWLAGCLPAGGRQLESAITQLEMLAKQQAGPLELATVTARFQEQAEAGCVTMERITARVAGYFRVKPGELQSQRRCRNVLVPRQVGMYLARQLTELSLNQIGDYFGGRDHSTVLHACRKVEDSLERDALLSGAVREIHAGLL